MRYLTLFAVFFLSSIFVSGCKDPVYVVNYEPGPIQVIGMDGEVWLFVEIDRMVARPHGAYDAPSRIPVGHWQEVIVLRETGEVTRTKVQRHENADGVTFNMNNSLIFRFGDRIVLYKIRSADNEPTVYEWMGQEFVRLTKEDNARFLAENGLDAGVKKVLTQLDKWSASGGWRLIHSDLNARDASYSWGELIIVQNVRFDQGTYRIEFLATNVALEPITIEFSGKREKISGAQFRALSREDSGYPKRNSK